MNQAGLANSIVRAVNSCHLLLHSVLCGRVAWTNCCRTKHCKISCPLYL
uniref:Uncharacterized protein MANES_06G056200 n=1 Tax=Rhizophora mucronata TaxID=61149 RepID=A0A2P2IXK2_RHIMU